jgi:threonyl-tRNA synthetase
MVIPVHKQFNDYAEQVKQTMIDSGFFCDTDLSGKTLDKKVLEHSLYNYILVVGKVEMENQSVNVRKRKEGEDDEQVGRDREVPLADFVKELNEIVAQHK